jgi:acyl carrier protein
VSTAHPQITAIHDQLRKIVLDYSSIDESELHENSPLLELVDSLGISELFEFVEEQIGRPLRVEEMSRKNFATMTAVADLIRTESVG